MALPDKPKIPFGVIQIATMNGDNLDEFVSEYSPAESQAEQDLWDEASGLATLLLAGLATSRFVFDEALQRYRYQATGRLVPDKAIRAGVRRLANAARRQMREETISMYLGEITPQQWYDAMAGLMKSAYGAAVDAASGGAQLTQAELTRFTKMMEEQFGYLNRFAKQLENGEQALNGTAISRAGMYGDATNDVFENWKRYEMGQAGFDEERRAMDASVENCETCIGEADKGWQPIGTLKALGDSECLTNCHCYFEYRKSSDKE
jgi:hypothetical protein